MSEEIKPGYTRVSQILEMLPTYTQGKWGYPMQQIDPYILARAADRGTNVHAAIEAYWRGEFYPLDDKEQGYFESFKKWCDKVKPKTVMSENRLYCDLLKITGAIDLVATLEDSTNKLIIDFKTTAVPDHKKWPFQAAFYYYLCKTNKIDVHDNVMFLSLASSGDLPQGSWYETADLKDCLNLLNLYRYLTNY